MFTKLRPLVAVALAALVIPLAANQAPVASQAEVAKLETLSEDCQLAAQSLLTEGCEETFLVEFASEAAQQRFDGERSDEIRGSFSSLNLSAYELNGQELGLLAKSPEVTRVVENVEFSIAETQTQDNAPWHLARIQGPTFDPVATSYQYTYDDTELGAGVRIYVVDTGINASHVEFTDRTIDGFSAIADGLGTQDCNGHGTHVAALAAGSAFGAAKAATVVPVRVLDCSGSGTLFGVLQGIDWIASNTFVRQPAIVNMSLGGAKNDVLDNAIANLVGQGLAFVVASGNSGTDACQVSPANVAGAITVGASSKTNQWPSFSNYGSCVDIAAPGVDIRSAWYSANNGEAVASGTSMAAAIVSGVAAVQMSDGYQTPADLAAAISADALRDVITEVPLGTPNALLQNASVFEPNSVTLGDAYERVTTEPSQDASTPVDVDPIVDTPGGGGSPAPSLPPTYAKPSVTTAGTTANVTWSIPEAAANLTGQVLKLYSGTTELDSFDLDATATSLVISQLAPGVVYRVAVAGVNDDGTGVLSPQSEPFEVAAVILGPEGGDFSAWVKKINDTQVKFYAKYPQLDDKIQFMVQQPNGVYKEIAWLRVEAEDVDESGNYVGLQNNIYFIRTINLRDGKNRLRIYLNGEQIDRTRTYSL